MNVEIERLLQVIGELEITRRVLAERVAELEAERMKEGDNVDQG